MDIVTIKGLTVNTIIGIHERERRSPQTISIDLHLTTDNKAAVTDNIEEALDYSAVAKRVTHFVEQSSYQLIESLAEQIADLLLREFNVRRLKLRVSKPGAIDNADNVWVTIERSGE